MANRRRPKYTTIVTSEDLKKLPLAYRFFLKKPTNSVGEMYKFVRFSSSRQLETESLNNYTDATPLSGLMLKDED